MQECRCRHLNVLSGAVAHDYARLHLEQRKTDGMGRRVLSCPDLHVEWVEEREPAGYGDDVVVLRRLTR
ncbi:MAG: hypothetical protein WD358_04450 [Nitriliruptoraceae bacterium]